MRILVYGAGVIGSIYAAKLALSGEDVTVLARGARRAEIQSQGLRLIDAQSGRQDSVRVHTVDCLSPDDNYDFVFVVLQNSQVQVVLPQLAANCSKNVVFVVNTAAGYSEWQRAIGKERVLVGFPSAGGERKNGVVSYFVGRGAVRLFQTTTFGEPDGTRSLRTAALITMFRKAGIPSVFSNNMDAWQKTHVAMVTCIANALYGVQCDHKRLAASKADIRCMILGIKEGFDVLKRIATRVTPFKLNFWMLPTGLLTFVFRWIMSTPLADLTMAKHCVVAHEEMLSLQIEFDLLIQKSGLSTPHIDQLRINLMEYALK
jgi:2-dehydropantoate 2-reductase